MKLSRLLVTFIASAFCATGVALAQVNLEEGKEYKKLAKPQPTEAGGKIEVIEFFSFGCNHCRDLEPHLQTWKKTLPPDVQFRRVPVAFQQAWVGLSKITFTLEALGELDRLAPDVFDAVHRDGKKMQDKEVFYAWATAKGLDAAKVKGAYEGFSVDSKIKRAEQSIKAYAVDSVPTIVVDGKFSTGPGMLKTSHAGIPPAIDFLIAKARKEKGK